MQEDFTLEQEQEDITPTDFSLKHNGQPTNESHPQLAESPPHPSLQGQHPHGYPPPYEGQ